MGDVKLTKRHYLLHNGTTSAHITNIIISSTATTAKGIKVKIFDSSETVLNLIETHYAQISCQEDVSAILQERLTVLS